MDVGAIAYLASVWVLPVLLAITLHEAAHGLVADRLGDDTARRAGRVTLNPIKHIHLVGTILLPGLLLALGAPFLFGFAKPVPVIVSRLRRPRRDGILVLFLVLQLGPELPGRHREHTTRPRTRIMIV